MTGMEIAVLAVGIVLILLSFLFFRENVQEVDTGVSIGGILVKDELEKIKEDFSEDIRSKSAEITNEVDDKLSKMSNETIIAVNDFSEQIIAKLNNNHDEVVFLYNMLQDKEEEMKSTLNRMEVIRKENNTYMEKMSDYNMLSESNKDNYNKAESSDTATNYNAGAAENTAGGRQGYSGNKKQNNRQSSKKSGSYKNKGKYDVRVSKNVEPEQIINETKTNEILSAGSSQQQKQDKILELYKNKMSVIDISRTLGLGQGEVKLIIDLYGK